MKVDLPPQGAAGNNGICENIKDWIPTCCLSDVRVFRDEITLVSRAFPCTHTVVVDKHKRMSNEMMIIVYILYKKIYNV